MRWAGLTLRPARDIDPEIRADHSEQDQQDSKFDGVEPGQFGPHQQCGAEGGADRARHRQAKPGDDVREPKDQKTVGQLPLTEDQNG
ncbi:hypothetical protein [Bradyrhizobium sp. CCBAU 51627]|uniref:hypothetical protein n=1 Tax=Bradyrhizobium sp. CCBAU 51627 TaxID=1325088 RepID=UPI0023062E5F|nr:hypothetical protein [Bradyrhizobium sp. CCBAU 51627]MDA9432519.1 hypothetical protein [Bradyrhizobium sp. CCBAU 51627]